MEVFNLMKYKKILPLLIAGFMLAGCGKETDNHGLDKNNPVTITIWHYYNGIQQISFDNMVNEFNETVGAENGIIVEAYTKSTISDLNSAVINSLNGDVSADAPPDIFAAYPETAFIADKMGKAADLNEYFTDKEKSEYIDDYIQEGQFNADGEFTIFPIAKSTEIMGINYTDWQKFVDSENVSLDDLKTWERVAKTAEKYYKYTDALTPDIKDDGKAFFGRDSIANYMLIGAEQLGSPFFSSENGKFEVNIDKDTLKKLWENYYVPYVKGYYTAQGRYRSDDAKIGNIIALVGSTTGISYFPSTVTIDDDYTYSIEAKVLPVPQFEGCKSVQVQQGAGMVVTKSDETHEYASAVFLKWFTQSDNNIEFSLNSAYLPVKKEANDISKINDVISSSEIEIAPILKDSIEISVEKINDPSVELYESPPFEQAEGARDFIGDFIQMCADEDYNEINDRVEAGEERAAVEAEYTSDKAFDEWFEQFKDGLEEIIS